MTGKESKPDRSRGVRSHTADGAPPSEVKASEQAVWSLEVNQWYGTVMTSPSAAPSTANARSLLLPYTITLFIALAALHTVIVATGGEITLLIGALTAVIAVGIAVWVWRNYRALTHVRFGVVIAHAVAFAAVTSSFNGHAMIRTYAIGSDSAGFDAAAQNLLATPWFGATLVMSTLWGIALLVHLLGLILARGWQD